MGDPGTRKTPDRSQEASELSAEEITTQAARIVPSACFRRARRLARFLEYAVKNALAGRHEALKETVLGIEVFDRGQDFDPSRDPIVRIDARRLRARLADYYQSEGAEDPVCIEFEPGSYVPRFRAATPQDALPKRLPAAAPKSTEAIVNLTKLAQARQQLESLTPAGIVKSMALFERIISSCAEAHAGLGALRALSDFDFAGANAAFLMASRLKPDSASVIQARAAFYLAPLGFLDEAAEEIRYALSRDSRSLLYLHNLGWIQYLQRDYAGAIATAELILDANRHLTPANPPPKSPARWR